MSKPSYPVPGHHKAGPRKTAQIIGGAEEVTTGGTTGVLGQATSTETAQAFGRLKTKAIVGAASTETAQALRAAHQRTLTAPTETDAAQAFGRISVKLLVGATSTEVAQAFTAAHLRLLTGAASSEVAQTFGRAHQRTLVAPTSVETAQAFGRISVKLLVGAASTEEAQSFGRAHLQLLGQATSVEQAQTFPTDNSISATIVAATETDAAQVFAQAKRLAIAAATSTETAQQLTTLKLRAIIGATSSEAAQPIGRDKAYTITASLSLEQAQRLGSQRAVLVPAVETDEAQPFSGTTTAQAAQQGGGGPDRRDEERVDRKGTDPRAKAFQRSEEAADIQAVPRGTSPDFAEAPLIPGVDRAGEVYGPDGKPLSVPEPADDWLDDMAVGMVAGTHAAEERMAGIRAAARAQRLQDDEAIAALIAVMVVLEEET